jgi:hypothetical protein
MNEEWKLQVSYKTGPGDMINIRANTADELSVLLEGVGDYATQIAATNKLLAGAYNVAPLSTPSTTTSTELVSIVVESVARLVNRMHSGHVLPHRVQLTSASQ